MLYFICEDCKNKINYVTLHPKYVIKMNKRKIYYLLHNGKNSNLKYFIKGYLREYTPKIFSQIMLEKELRKIEKRPDRDYIYQSISCPLCG